MTLPGQHADLLASYGATAAEIEELLAYNHNVFDRSVDQAPTLPLPAEPHVAAWERYAREAAEVGAFAALRRRLVQLRFPIREGISKTDAYRAATLRGASTARDGRSFRAEPRESRRSAARGPPEPSGPDTGPCSRRPGGLRRPGARPDDEERTRTRAGVYGGMHGLGLQQLGPHQGVPASVGSRRWRPLRSRLARRVSAPRAEERTVSGQVFDPQHRSLQQRRGR